MIGGEMSARCVLPALHAGACRLDGHQQASAREPRCERVLSTSTLRAQVCRAFDETLAGLEEHADGSWEHAYAVVTALRVEVLALLDGPRS